MNDLLTQGLSNASPTSLLTQGLLVVDKNPPVQIGTAPISAKVQRFTYLVPADNSDRLTVVIQWYLVNQDDEPILSRRTGYIVLN